MDVPGWFLVTILAPLILPIFGVLPLKLLPVTVATGTVRVMATVKDGQLCWAVVAMGAATIYELWRAAIAHRALPAYSGALLATVMMMMLAAILLAAGGAVFSTPLIDGLSGGVKAWIVRYKVFVGSVALSAITAVICTGLHFSLPDACAG